MIVTILDVEWFARKSYTPKIVCMQLSSYHKQLGDIVTFANTQLELNLVYDIIYVVREDIAVNLPKSLIVRDKKVRLIGSGFRFFSNYVKDVGPVVSACRPDYLLYPLLEGNKSYNTNMVQFFSNGRIMNKRQNFRASGRHTKNTHITDKDFWHYGYEDLAVCCKELRNETNIIFDDGVPFDVLLQDKRKEDLFFGLKLKNEVISLTEYDIDKYNWEKVDSFVKRLVKEKPTFPRPIVYMPVDYSNHLDNSTNAKEAFIDIFTKVAEGRLIGIQYGIPLVRRIETPQWLLFEALHVWTTRHIHKSFVEFMLAGCCFLNKVDYHILIQSPNLWTTTLSRTLMELNETYPELIDKYGYNRMGNRKQKMNLKGEYIWKD